MVRYNSFNHKNSKLNDIWSKVKTNSSELNNVPILSLNFDSINFNKEIVTIPILTNELLPVLPLSKTSTVLLENFPEWALNMIEPTVIYTIEDGFVENLIDTSLAVANANGTLKTGDVSIGTQTMEYWFNRVDKAHFLLKILYDIRIFSAIKTGGGFSSSIVPKFANISLKIYNQRIYELMDEKFE